MTTYQVTLTSELLVNAAATVVSETSADAVVQLVSDPAVESCDVSLYCRYNVSDVVGVELHVKSSSSADWKTVYRFNATANRESWDTKFEVGHLFAVFSPLSTTVEKENNP